MWRLFRRRRLGSTLQATRAARIFSVEYGDESGFGGCDGNGADSAGGSWRAGQTRRRRRKRRLWNKGTYETGGESAARGQSVRKRALGGDRKNTGETASEHCKRSRVIRAGLQTGRTNGSKPRTRRTYDLTQQGAERLTARGVGFHFDVAQAWAIVGDARLVPVDGYDERAVCAAGGENEHDCRAGYPVRFV